MIKTLSFEEIAEVCGSAKESTWLYNIGGTLLGAGVGAVLGGVTAPAAPIVGALGAAFIAAGAVEDAMGN